MSWDGTEEARVVHTNSYDFYISVDKPGEITIRMDEQVSKVHHELRVSSEKAVYLRKVSPQKLEKTTHCIKTTGSSVEIEIPLSQ